MSINQRIGHLIDNVLNIKQKSFAERIGISPSQLNAIIKGRDSVGLGVIEKIHKEYTSVNLHWLITGDGTELNRDITLDNTSQTKEILMLNKQIIQLQEELKAEKERTIQILLKHENQQKTTVH